MRIGDTECAQPMSSAWLAEVERNRRRHELLDVAKHIAGALMVPVPAGAQGWSIESTEDVARVAVAAARMIIAEVDKDNVGGS